MSVSSLRFEHQPEEARLIRTYPLLIKLKIVVPQSGVYTNDMISCAFCESRAYSVLGKLNVLLDKGNSEHFFLLICAFASGSSHTAMKERVELFKDWCFLTVLKVGFFFPSDIEILLEAIYCWSACTWKSSRSAWKLNDRSPTRTFFHTRLQVPMHPQHMLRYHPVPLLIHIVRYHKQQIETGQERIRQSDVSMRVFMHVVLTVDRIRSCNDGTTSIE